MQNGIISEVASLSLSPSGAKCGYFRQDDGRTDGLSDWLDDNEAASGDFAAELIFYSRSSRLPSSLDGVCEPVTDGRPIWGWEFALRLPRKTGAAARELGKFPRGSLAVEFCFVGKWYLASCDRAVCLCAILPSGRYPSL